VILAAFGVDPTSPCLTQVHHINQVRHDNRLENLEWIAPGGFDVTCRTPETQPEQEDVRREEVEARARQAGIRRRGERGRGR
jgi:hypothetical protein